MKLWLIRHADPDYEHDSLTEKGWREAEYLSERLVPMEIRDFYVSPLGRAKDTAGVTLKKMNRTATQCEWLREFAPRVRRPDSTPTRGRRAWDWLPQDWTGEERFYTYEHWFEVDCMKDARVEEEYRWVTQSFDELLAEHGYVRDGRFYRAVGANNDTLVFFCHYGVECVLLSHLMSISPMPLWHGLCAAPSSVTIVNTEERREGIASFRAGTFGDISHLYVHGEEPSFSARFCECFKNAEERHD